jgi:ArsR family metal-binding transcriptional regulator
MLIEDYEIALSTPACDLSSPLYLAKLSFDADIGEVLPYVNATVEKGEFLPGLPVLVWREGGRKYALRPSEISISSLSDREEAERAAREIVDRVNAVWEDRANLEPSYATWERPKVLEIFKLLPRTNCGECGVPACMAFASDLSKGKKRPEDCPPLREEGCAEALKALHAMGL